MKTPTDFSISPWLDKVPYVTLQAKACGGPGMGATLTSAVLLTVIVTPVAVSQSRLGRRNSALAE